MKILFSLFLCKNRRIEQSSRMFLTRAEAQVHVAMSVIDTYFSFLKLIEVFTFLYGRKKIFFKTLEIFMVT